MVKNIMRDPLFLSQKSETVTKEDLQIGRDLMDTLRANRERSLLLHFIYVSLCVPLRCSYDLHIIPWVHI